jgi:hypothetical protein
MVVGFIVIVYYVRLSNNSVLMFSSSYKEDYFNQLDQLGK